MIQEFEVLDRKRLENRLDGDEAERWRAIKNDLTRVLQGYAYDDGNRRHTLRVDVSLEVSFVDPQGLGGALLKNVSGGGIQIETKQLITAGDRATLVIHVQKPERTIEVSGEVVWVRGVPTLASAIYYVAGLRFVDLSEDAEKAINELVYDELRQKADGSDA